MSLENWKKWRLNCKNTKRIVLFRHKSFDCEANQGTHGMIVGLPEYHTYTHIQPQISTTNRGDSQTYPLDPSGNQTLYNEKSSIDSWCSYNKNKQLKWMFSCHACLPEGIQQCQPIDESTALSLVASNWQGAQISSAAPEQGLESNMSNRMLNDLMKHDGFL